MMASDGEDAVTAEEFEGRIRIMLPDQYQDSYKDVATKLALEVLRHFVAGRA